MQPPAIGRQDDRVGAGMSVNSVKKVVELEGHLTQASLSGLTECSGRIKYLLFPVPLDDHRNTGIPLLSFVLQEKVSKSRGNAVLLHSVAYRR